MKIFVGTNLESLTEVEVQSNTTIGDALGTVITGDAQVGTVLRNGNPAKLSDRVRTMDTIVYSSESSDAASARPNDSGSEQEPADEPASASDVELGYVRAGIVPGGSLQKIKITSSGMTVAQVLEEAEIELDADWEVMLNSERVKDDALASTTVKKGDTIIVTEELEGN